MKVEPDLQHTTSLQPDRIQWLCQWDIQENSYAHSVWSHRVMYMNPYVESRGLVISSLEFKPLRIPFLCVPDDAVYNGTRITPASVSLSQCASLPLLDDQSLPTKSYSWCADVHSSSHQVYFGHPLDTCSYFEPIPRCEIFDALFGHDFVMSSQSSTLSTQQWILDYKNGVLLQLLRRERWWNESNSSEAHNAGASCICDATRSVTVWTS